MILPKSFGSIFSFTAFAENNFMHKWASTLAESFPVAVGTGKLSFYRGIARIHADKNPVLWFSITEPYGQGRISSTLVIFG